MKDGVLELTLALRDLITHAGAARLLGGRLGGAVAEERPAETGGALVVAVGGKHYRIHITEWNQEEYDAERTKHYRP